MKASDVLHTVPEEDHRLPLTHEPTSITSLHSAGTLTEVYCTTDTLLNCRLSLDSHTIIISVIGN